MLALEQSIVLRMIEQQLYHLSRCGKRFLILVVSLRYDEIVIILFVVEGKFTISSQAERF